jgi:dihydrofolate synthase/folylpolyglutamate synthase
MTYTETCHYLFNQMPMFERQGASGYKEGLANTLALDEHFGHPHRSYTTIHVAGTNGKGSVSHTIAAHLQQCGYRVGLYTSPHLVDFRERIRINGKPISEQYVIDFVESERNFFEPLHPSFFEVTTAMAFKYFKDKEIDIAVVEVGLGGRLDCTNIITPIVSVITNISYDHTQFLGHTLAEIAAEKAGIIKKGVPVIIGESNEETRPVFEAKAREVNTRIVFADDVMEVVSATPTADGGMDYQTAHLGTLHGDLGGLYQAKNTNTVLYVLKELAESGYLADSRRGNNYERCRFELEESIRNVAAMTGLMGRWQIVRKEPTVVCDTGHNVGGWQYLSQQLSKQECRQMHIVFGMVDDKDIDGVLSLLPANARYYFTKADTHRALNEVVVKTLAERHNLTGEAFPTVQEAYQSAMLQALPDDFVFVGGSSYVVGDFLKTCI